MDLTFKEPELITIPEFVDGKPIDRVYEILPLSVEDMKMTVQFAELQKEIDAIRAKSNKETVKKAKGRKPKKPKEPEKSDIPTVLSPNRNVSEEEEKFVVDKLLPLLVDIVEKGLVDYETQEPIELPRRYKTLPKIMAIAMKIINLTTETNTPVNMDFREIGQPNNK